MKNYHTHTTRCHHAIGSEEEYILAAIKTGYTTLGFSDHTPWHYDSGYVSGMRMKESELEDYVSTLVSLKEKYKDQIEILIGLEVEYFSKNIPWLKQTINDYHLDYIILGNHFSKTDEYGEYYGYSIDKTSLTTYVDECIEAMKIGLFSYVAHPDLANYKNIDDPFYYQEMKRLTLTALELDIPLEFNLLGYAQKRNYPNDVFFNIVKETGNKVIIGVDAHQTSALETTQYYDEAKAYLEGLGLEIVEDIQLFGDQNV